MATVKIRPAADDGARPDEPGSSGATLVRRYATEPVEEEVTSDWLHNHVCGCTKCWKPAVAAFSMASGVPSVKVKVTRNARKRKVIGRSAPIRRHARTECSTHMHGRVTRASHPFTGRMFIHADLADREGFALPISAALVSPANEGGTRREQMGAVRPPLNALGRPPHDALLPGLMDCVAACAARASGVPTD